MRRQGSNLPKFWPQSRLNALGEGIRLTLHFLVAKSLGDLHAEQRLCLSRPWKGTRRRCNAHVERGNLGPESCIHGQLARLSHQPFNVCRAKRLVFRLNKRLGCDVGAWPSISSRNIRQRRRLVEHCGQPICLNGRESVGRYSKGEFDVVSRCCIVSAGILESQPKVARVGYAAVVADLDAASGYVRES